MPFKSLASRITAYLTIGAVIIIVTSVMVLRNDISSKLFSEIKAKKELIIESEMEDIANAIVNQNIRQLDYVIKRLHSRQSAVFISIIDNQQKTIISVGEKNTGKSEKLVFISKDISSSDSNIVENLGTINAIFDYSAMDKLINDSLVNSTLVAAIMSVILILFIYIITRHLIDPITKLSGNLVAISDNDSASYIVNDFSSNITEIGQLFSALKILQAKNVEYREQLIISKDQAESSNAIKSEFLANMSHELRTPLNSMLILAEELKDNEKGNLSGEQIKSVSIIYDSGKTLLQLINDILDISKVESGKIELDICEVSLKSISKSMKNYFSHIAAKKGLDFSVNIPKKLPEYIISDEMRIEQILRNFISNAIKFTKTGCVTVNFYRPNPSEIQIPDFMKEKDIIAISVTDTGIGIPEDKLKTVFEAFIQADSSTSRKYGGTGLGLSISRELSGLLGGYIFAESIEGAGSSFTLLIPDEFTEQITHVPEGNKVAVQSKGNQTHDLTENLASSSGVIENLDSEIDDEYRQVLQDKKVLIIDSDMRNIYAMSKILKSAGMKVFLASDGIRALEELEKNDDLDIVLLDIVMPVMDGYEIIQRIRSEQHFDNQSILIVALTSESAKQDEQLCISIGANDYIMKPIDKKQLFSVMKKLIGTEND